MICKTFQPKIYIDKLNSFYSIYLTIILYSKQKIFIKMRRLALPSKIVVIDTECYMIIGSSEYEVKLEIYNS